MRPLLCLHLRLGRARKVEIEHDDGVDTYHAFILSYVVVLT